MLQNRWGWFYCPTSVVCLCLCIWTTTLLRAEFEPRPKAIDDFLCFPALPASLFWPANPCLSQREIHKRWICSSTHHSSSFTGQTQASIPPHPLLSTLIQLEPIERLKKLKLRHDERGSQRSAGCGQVKRAGRHVGWRFLISTRPTSSLPGTWCCFCRGKVRQVEKNRVQHLLFILLNSATYVSPSFLCL